jgi:catechol 2,3-dioxygenase-like lactoylglutathione lyase family enzyme
MTSEPLTGLLGRVAPRLFQQAYVVADIEAAQQAFRDHLGCAKFTTLPATPLPYRFRGRDVECALALAFGRSGGVQIELLQPVSGEGVHVEFLASNGPGAHHLAFYVDDLEAELAQTRRDGIADVMAGEFGSLRFAYLDTFEALGLYTELVEDPDGMMEQLTPKE